MTYDIYHVLDVGHWAHDIQLLNCKTIIVKELSYIKMVLIQLKKHTHTTHKFNSYYTWCLPKCWDFKTMILEIIIEKLGHINAPVHWITFWVCEGHCVPHISLLMLVRWWFRSHNLSPTYFILLDNFQLCFEFSACGSCVGTYDWHKLNVLRASCYWSVISSSVFQED